MKSARLAGDRSVLADTANDGACFRPTVCSVERWDPRELRSLEPGFIEAGDYWFVATRFESVIRTPAEFKSGQSSVGIRELFLNP
jgi:hypothetical protein